MSTSLVKYHLTNRSSCTSEWRECGNFCSKRTRTWPKPPSPDLTSPIRPFQWIRYHWKHINRLLDHWNRATRSRDMLYLVFSVISISYVRLKSALDLDPNNVILMSYWPGKVIELSQQPISQYLCNQDLILGSCQRWNRLFEPFFSTIDLDLVHNHVTLTLNRPIDDLDVSGILLNIRMDTKIIQIGQCEAYICNIS